MLEKSYSEAKKVDLSDVLSINAEAAFLFAYKHFNLFKIKSQ